MARFMIQSSSSIIFQMYNEMLNFLVEESNRTQSEWIIQPDHRLPIHSNSISCRIESRALRKSSFGTKKNYTPKFEKRSAIHERNSYLLKYVRRLFGDHQRIGTIKFPRTHENRIMNRTTQLRQHFSQRTRSHKELLSGWHTTTQMPSVVQGSQSDGSKSSPSSLVFIVPILNPAAVTPVPTHLMRIKLKRFGGGWELVEIIKTNQYKKKKKLDLLLCCSRRERWWGRRKRSSPSLTCVF